MNIFLRDLKESKVQIMDFSYVNSNSNEMQGKLPKISFSENVIFQKLPVRFLRKPQNFGRKKDSKNGILKHIINSFTKYYTSIRP